MTEYLIKSGLILIILLAIYHIWLEKEKMHQFNRFFLLLSIIFGLTVPLISFEVSSKMEVNDLSPIINLASAPLINTFPEVTNQAIVEDYSYWPVMIYGIVALLLLLKFVVNLLRLRLKISKNQQKRTAEGTIVLIKENVIPHSFLSYTFLNEGDYLNNRIEDEIIRHEFAHIRQKHSADLLFIEFLKIIFWFNPVFLLYKKAIQLNHEFLADEAVVKLSNNVSAYQQILLQKASLKTINLASNLNYSVTKKRFKMMKKQTSKTWKMIKGLSMFPVAVILILTLSDQNFVQAESANSKIKSRISPVSSSMLKDEYYKGGLVRYLNTSGDTLTKKYEALTYQEKKAFPDPLVPTKELMKTWNDHEKYIILSGTEKINESINNLKPDDFVAYYLYKSETEKQTYVTLIKPEWIENFKKHGGIFKINTEGLRLMLPPPVIIHPKK